MAKKSIIARDLKRKNMIAQYAAKRAELKELGDLEGLAKHRGSAFGATPEGQPGQVDFENALAINLIHLASKTAPILIESESRMIGHRRVPDALFEKMRLSPKLVLEVSIEERVQRILNLYILESSLGLHGDLNRFEYFRKAAQIISKKLGGLRAQELINDMKLCEQKFITQKDLHCNRIWIEKLLVWYYDPLYDYSFNLNR